jgi:hypothetical protein
MQEAHIMKTFTAQFADVPMTIDAGGSTVLYPATASAGNSRDSSAANSRNNSVEHPADHGGNLTAALVEASLHNEFKDSPAPKPGATYVSLQQHSKRSGAGKVATVSSSSHPQDAAPVTTAAATGGGWMSGLFSSFTSHYSATAAPSQAQAVARQHRTPRKDSTHNSDASAAHDTQHHFKPKELRPKLTQEQVSRRLDGYLQQHQDHEQDRNLSQQTVELTPAKGHATEEGEVQGEEGYTVLSPSSQAESLIALTPAVLYYCSCLISKMPGAH